MLEDAERELKVHQLSEAAYDLIIGKLQSETDSEQELRWALLATVDKIMQSLMISLRFELTKADMQELLRGSATKDKSH